MAEAEIWNVSNGHFEARKIGMRQNKEGVIISFVVQPDDYEAALMMVPVGKRLMIAWAEIGDDEKPTEDSHGAPETVDAVPRPQANEAGTLPKPKRPFASLSLAEQAGIRCGDDEEFMNFFDTIYDRRIEESLADGVRRMCNVKSRAEFNTDPIAAQQWIALEARYQRWLTDRNYADARR